MKDLELAERIEVGGRLVEHQDARLQRQRGGDRQPLLLAAGERARVAVREPGEAHRRQRLRDAAAHLVRRHAKLLHAEGDLLQHVGGEELRFEVLRDQSDNACQIGDPFVATGGVP